MAARTQRLYQRDSFLTRFSATVLDVRAEPGEHPEASARIAVVLDRTAFYPTGGGQPFDTGTLGALPVVDVRESDEGPLHIVELRDAGGRPHGAHLTVGGEVEGTVDRERRFDHMQQHSGQHVLSRAFIDAADARTRSFHLGASICTIDVDLPRPSEEIVRAAEAQANEALFRDAAVVVREVPAEESPPGAPVDPAMSGLNLKPGDPVRFIEFEGYDSTACGGTHVARAGQVGLAAVLGWEPYKGICRVTFVCGGRVLARLRDDESIISGCVSRLSSPRGEITATIDRLGAERDARERRLRALADLIVESEAREIAASAPVSGPYRIFRRTFSSEERSVEEAQNLARRFVEEPGRIALVAVVEKGAATILAGRSSGGGPEGSPLPKMGEVVGEVSRAVGGRGGGSATFARAGGIPEARVEEVLDAAAARLIPGAASPRS